MLGIGGECLAQIGRGVGCLLGTCFIMSKKNEKEIYNYRIRWQDGSESACTADQLIRVAEAVKAVYDASEQTRGLKMVYEPRYLRFFQARFERIG